MQQKRARQAPELVQLLRKVKENSHFKTAANTTICMYIAIHVTLYTQLT